MTPSTYTITVTNHGPNATDDTSVVDPSPGAANIVSFTASTGTFDPDARLWTIPHLDDGDVATLTVNVLLDANAAGPYQNVVVIQSSRVTDPDLTNNGALANLYVPVADIAVTKTVDDPTPTIGDDVTFTIGLTNLGPDQADAVTVDDLASGRAHLRVRHTVRGDVRLGDRGVDPRRRGAVRPDRGSAAGDAAHRRDRRTGRHVHQPRPVRSRRRLPL